jgi:Replication initiator protein A/DnaA N-terminal domain
MMMMFLYFSLETENDKIVVMLSFIRSLFFGTTNHQLERKPMAYTKNRTKSVKPQYADSASSKQVAILEADEQSTDLLPQGIIRSEVNFLRLPFFALSDSDVRKRTETEYKDVIQRGDQRLEIQWNVAAHPKYGYPSPFDRKVHRAIEHIISEIKPPIANPIPLGSLASLAKLIGLQVSKRGAAPGWFYDQIREAILRIKHTAIESRGAFYHKDKGKRILDSFSLYERAVFVGEELDNGEIADTNYLYLGSWYLENINSRYVKPLDYTYYRTLQRPISARLYELLGVKFSGSPFINYRYSKLCQLLPVTQYKYLSKAKEKIEPAHQELIRTGFLDNVKWEKVKDDPHDWYVNYWAGERAKKEIQQARKQGVLPPLDDLQLEQPTATSTPQQVGDDVNDLVVALQNFGISKKTAKRLAKNHPEQDVFEKLQLVQWLVDTKSPLVSKNPQGFLVKALDEGYLPQPPKGYKTADQRKEEAERQNLELEQQKQITEQFQKAREEVKQRLLEKHPPQPIKGTDHTTQTAWSKVLAALKEQVSTGNYNGWLKDTVLLQVTDTAARIAAPSRLACTQLEYRLYREISSAMKGILGKDLDLEFVVASPE